jgi:hypothetical protein
MGLRTSNSPWKTRTFRPNVMHLEDRVVPGEMFGTSMLWAMGAFTDPAVLVPDNSASDRSQADAIRTVAAADSYAPALPYADSSTLTICQVDSAAADTPDGSTTSPSSAPAGTPAGSTAPSTSDQVFSDMNSDSEFGDLSDDLSGSSAAMGDVLHPGTQTPAIPNAAAGATGPALQSAIPGLSAPVLGGGGGSTQGGHSLAALAGFLGSAGSTPLMSAISAATSQPAAAATGAGGSSTPLNSAHAVAAPSQAHAHAAANAAAPFDPAQISQAYGLNLINNTGAGQTIYIIDAYNDPNIASDLKTFDAQWGLANPTLTVHEMSSRVSNSTSWAVEESLDVEWAHAIAPAANIELVEATSSSNANLFAAVNYATTSGATIVSMSWGGADASSDTSYNSDFEHAGVTYIASAGDSAAEVEYPAASPYVLSVGGTTLTLTSSNAYSSESAWSDSGGGVSKSEALPGYQSSYGIKNSGRSIPDVAWDANPSSGVYVYDSDARGGGGWYEVGGTSVGAPSWAGIVALADQGRSTPLTTDNLTSRTEYNAATGSIYASNYHDITTGSNGHAAGVGYDLVTGVGTPQANNLVPWLTNNS